MPRVKRARRVEPEQAARVGQGLSVEPEVRRGRPGVWLSKVRLAEAVMEEGPMAVAPMAAGPTVVAPTAEEATAAWVEEAMAGTEAEAMAVLDMADLEEASAVASSAEGP